MVRKNVVSDGMAMQRMLSASAPITHSWLFSVSTLSLMGLSTDKEEITTRTRVAAQISGRVGILIEDINIVESDERRFNTFTQRLSKVASPPCTPPVHQTCYPTKLCSQRSQQRRSHTIPFSN